MPKKEREEGEEEKREEKRRRKNGISEVDYWRREGEWYVGKEERKGRQK